MAQWWSDYIDKLREGKSDFELLNRLAA